MSIEGGIFHVRHTSDNGGDIKTPPTFAVTSTSQHLNLLGRLNQGECGGRGMWHAWERGETCTGF
jgi:hypothetical protein